ncbi:MAG: MATE family efflux transporter [Christensenellales bacterium]
MERNWTTGSVFKNILFFSLPYLLSYFLQTLYGLADLFIIGQFGSVADTSAVSIGSQVMHMLTVMIVGLAMGSTVMIGRFIGEKKNGKAAKTVGNTVVLFMSVSIVITVILLFLTRAIVSVMDTPEEAVRGTVDYLTVCFIGIPFITAYNIISSIFRGLGDTKSPMYFIAVACVCNIALDCLFIGAFRLGPLGAALGTTISQTISVIFALIVILRAKTGVKITKSDFRLEKSTVGDILKIGVPVAIQDGLIQIAFIIITVFANNRGLDDSAAVGIVEKIICILFLVPSSMLSAVSALAAQNLGANEERRAKLTLMYSTVIAVSYGIIVSVIVFFIAKPLVSVFNDESENVAVLGSQYLRGYIWDTIFAGVHFCFSGYFCACKKSYISFMHNVLSIVFVRVPVSYFAAKTFADTLFPMGVAAPLGSALSVVVCLIAFAVLSKHRKPKPCNEA